MVIYFGSVITGMFFDTRIKEFNEFNFIKTLFELNPNDEVNNINCSITDLIFTNTKIIDKSNHWSLILFQESIAINRMKPTLNHGTKASKDLSIFN